MAKGLYFVNKTSTSDQLSSSSLSETREIRSHVQNGLRHAPRGSRKAKRASTLRSRDITLSPSRTPTPARAIVFRYDADPSATSKKPVTKRPEKGNHSRVSPPATNTAVKDSAQQTYLLPRALALANLNLSEDEHISLSLFATRTATQWSGWHDGPFWQSLVLQACVQSKAVAHTLISFAALDRASDLSCDQASRALLRALAARQTSKAITAHYESKASALVSITLNVIFICLTNFQDTRLAQQLIRSGNNPLQQFAHAKSGLGITEHDRHMVQSHIRPLMERLETRYCVIIDAVAAFARSVQLSRIRGDPRHEPPRVPGRFESLTSAQKCVSAILAWGHDAVPDTGSSSEEMDSFRARVQDYCDSWLAAFKASTVSPSSTEKQNDTRSGKLLHVALLHGQVLLSTYNTPTETIFDDYIPQHQTIASILKQIHLSSTTEGRHNFGIDSGLLDILAFLVQRCRDPPLRHDMLRLLERSDRVEGDRVSSIGTNILRALVDAEETNRRPRRAADIPEHARLRAFEDHQYFGLARIRVLMLTAPYDVARGARVLEHWVDIPPSPFVQSTKLAPARAAGIDVPTMIYGAHRAAFLQDASARRYHHFSFKRFYFPIPRT